VTAPAELHSYLVANGADRQPHGRRFLLDHLEGVHRILVGAKSEPDVCAAVLFHSVYGTALYKPRLVDTARRDEIQRLIGARAEEIVWAFCTLQMRAKALDLSLQCGNHDWLAGKVACRHCEPDRLWSDLIRVECANLLEQHALQEFPSIGRHAREIGIVDAEGFLV